MRKERKKLHKKVMKFLKHVNYNIQNDDFIGLNRFKVELVTEDYHRYSDGSGGNLYMVFKLSDTLAENCAYVYFDYYEYKWKIWNYLNDFMIRCSSGLTGHFPKLHYLAYDVHSIVPYEKYKDKEIVVEDGIINKYDWTGKYLKED